MEARSWPRKHFEPGGGNAFVFYQVFGRLKKDLDISGDRYRTAGLPEGVGIKYHDRETHADAFGWFKPGYLWDLVHQNHPELAQSIDQAPGCIRIQGTVSDPPTLDFLRDIIGVVTAVLDSGGEVVFDPQSFKWWAPDDWRRNVFEPEDFVPRRHTVVMNSHEEDGSATEWIHTRGMRKFGRPDISIHRVPPRYLEAAVDLCDLLIQSQAFGEIVPEGEEIRVASLPAGMTCHHEGSLDDIDFNNVHLEIRHDGKLGMPS